MAGPGFSKSYEVLKLVGKFHLFALCSTRTSVSEHILYYRVIGDVIMDDSAALDSSCLLTA